MYLQTKTANSFRSWREFYIRYQHGITKIYIGKRNLPVIADVQDRNRIFDIVSEYKPDVIYHAAAHKHVPLMEENPMVALKNNVFGTNNVAKAADVFGVEYFFLVSTDKAVNPTNIMRGYEMVC